MDLLRRLIYRLRGEISTKDLVKLGLTVGDNFQRNEHCIIDQSHCWLIYLGDNVTLAPNVHILAHDASMYNACRHTKIAPVRIGNNVFIGAGSIILPGVSIGDDCVIGAGSVVTKDVPNGSVATGNPARVVTSYDDFTIRNMEAMKDHPCFDTKYTLRNPSFDSVMKKRQASEVQKYGFGYVE